MPQAAPYPTDVRCAPFPWHPDSGAVCAELGMQVAQGPQLAPRMLQGWFLCHRACRLAPWLPPPSSSARILAPVPNTGRSEFPVPFSRPDVRS